MKIIEAKNGRIAKLDDGRVLFVPFRKKIERTTKGHAWLYSVLERYPNFVFFSNVFMGTLLVLYFGYCLINIYIS